MKIKIKNLVLDINVTNITTAAKYINNHIGEINMLLVTGDDVVEVVDRVEAAGDNKLKIYYKTLSKIELEKYLASLLGVTALKKAC